MESEAFSDGAPAEHKGGVDAGLIWAIAEANRLKKETR
jgi:hypothetical protein